MRRSRRCDRVHSGRARREVGHSRPSRHGTPGAHHRFDAARGASDRDNRPITDAGQRRGDSSFCSCTALHRASIVRSLHGSFSAQAQYAARFVLNRVVGMADALLDCLDAVGDPLVEQGCDGRRMAGAIQLIGNTVRPLQALASAAR